MICNLGYIPSKLVIKHTFPDDKESMFLENDLRKKNDFGHTIFQINQMAISSNPWVHLQTSIPKFMSNFYYWRNLILKIQNLVFLNF